MIYLLLPIRGYLPLYNLIVRSGGMVISQYEPFHCQSIHSRRVNNWLPFVVLSCPVVYGLAIIPNFQSILVKHIIADGGVPLHTAPWVPPTAVFIEISCKDTSALGNDSLPIQHCCLSRFWLHVSLILNIDNPRYLLSSPPDVSDNDILFSSRAVINPLINHQPTSLSYRWPKSFSLSYFICQVADPNTPSFAQWIQQAHFYCLMFDPWLLRHNDPLVQPAAVVLDCANHW